ncbi:coiled-coil domain-containing protein 24 [Lissotriton helveticus]
MSRHADDRDSGFGEVLEPPPSLWRLVEEYVPQSERPEVKTILGEAAVDFSLELHAEVETLLELWREVRSTGFSPIQRLPVSSCPVLADPPAIKDMVRQEIRMLLFSIRQKARKEGRDENQALSKYNPHVVSFVMGTGRTGSGVSRPPSTRGRNGGQEMPNRPWTAGRSSVAGDEERSASSLSTDSSLAGDLEDLKEKFNMSGIDEVVAHLRSILEEECRTLEKDIAIMQSCLEDEHCFAAEVIAPTPEPTLAELKEERRALERDLQLGQSKPSDFQTSKTLSQKPLEQSSRPLDSSGRIPAKTATCPRPSTTSSAVSSFDSRTPPCPRGARTNSETFRRLSISARTPITTRESGDVSRVTNPKITAPGTAKMRRPEVATSDRAHQQTGNKVHRSSSISKVDSVVPPSVEHCMAQVPAGQLGVLTVSSTPFLKARLSHVMPASSSLLAPVGGVQGLQSATRASENLGLVFIPTPPPNPPNHRPAGKSALSSASAPSPNRRVKLLQSTQPA